MNIEAGGLFQARPSPFRQVAARHLPGFLFSGLILLGSFWLSAQRCSIYPCPFLHLTGYPCLSCGWTRGFIAMAHGRWQTVLQDCPLAMLLYALVALIFAWNAAALIFGVRLELGRPARLSAKRARWLLWLAGFLIIANWLYRLGLGLK